MHILPAYAVLTFCLIMIVTVSSLSWYIKFRWIKYSSCMDSVHFASSKVLMSCYYLYCYLIQMFDLLCCLWSSVALVFIHTHTLRKTMICLFVCLILVLCGSFLSTVIRKFPNIISSPDMNWIHYSFNLLMQQS